MCNGLIALCTRLVVRVLRLIITLRASVVGARLYGRSAYFKYTSKHNDMKVLVVYYNKRNEIKEDIFLSTRLRMTRVLRTIPSAHRFKMIKAINLTNSYCCAIRLARLEIHVLLSKNRSVRIRLVWGDNFTML